MNQSMKNKLLPGFLAIGVLLVATAPPAYAYIDPGTGSLILQMLVAGFFTLLILMKKVRTRIKDFFSRIFTRNSDEQSK